MVDPTELVVVKDPAQDIGAEFSTRLLRVHCLLLVTFLTVILLFNRRHIAFAAHEMILKSERAEKKLETKMS